MRGLKNKRAIVTGGGQGIGLACVTSLVKQGCSVTLCDMSDIGAEAANELATQGFDVHFIKGDMTDESFCHDIVNFAVQKMVGIDFLINNAFSFIAEGINSTRDEWLRSLTVGPMAFSTMIQACHQPMIKAGGGSIVNMSSISAHIAQPNRWTYNSAKGAVNQLTKCAALDLAPDNIRVNSVSPGWIWTNAVDQAAGFDRDKYDPIWGKYHMLRRCGQPEEVANAVTFLLSDEASYITGTDLPVDGGYLGLGGEGLGEQSNIPNIA